MSKVLVIGGGGFIGRHLVERLMQDSNDINVVDIKRPYWLSKDVTFFETSFISDSLELRNAFFGVDIVYHLASTTLPQSSNEDPIFDIQSNLCGAINLLELANSSQVSKFIFASSGGTIYGPSDDYMFYEHSPTNPICSYGIVKLAIEKYMSIYAKNYSFSTCSLRISNPYGNYQNISKGQGVIPIFINNILNERLIEIWGDGSVSRDFIHIDDVIDAMLAVRSVEFSHEIFNISSNSSHSLNYILDIISEYIGKKINVIYKDKRELDVPKVQLNNCKAAEQLGWKPSIDLVCGIRRTIEEMKSNS